MDPLVRIVVIVCGIASLFIFLFLNKYVAERYWLSAIEDEEEWESTDEGQRERERMV